MEVLRKIVIFFFFVITVINYDYNHNGRKTDLFLLYRDTEEAVLLKGWAHNCLGPGQWGTDEG